MGSVANGILVSSSAEAQAFVRSRNASNNMRIDRFILNLPITVNSGGRI